MLNRKTALPIWFAFGLLVWSGCGGESASSTQQSAKPEGAAPPPMKAPNFPQNNTKLVNYKTAMANNPALLVVENEAEYADPITGPAKMYKAMASKIEKDFMLKHNIEIHHAQFDEYPSFETVEGWLKQSPNELKGLYPWQVYAYNPDDGSVVILQDQEYKKQMYKEAGLPEPQN